MRLKDTLFADLGRQYLFAGQHERKATLMGVITGAFSPRFAPVVIFRLSHWCFERRLPVLPKALSLVNFVVFGLEVAVRCKIGPGLYFPHTQGTVIGALEIGDNATIYHNVTFGAREIDIDYSTSSRPVVGNNVIVGSGAKVLGPVVLGDNVRVGANAVVVDDVASDLTVVGIPARSFVNKA
jgi:serine O-acetyltransferase